MGKRQDEELDAAMQRALDSWLPNSQKGGKPTYDESNILGGSKHTEGKPAVKASKRRKW